LQRNLDVSIHLKLFDDFESQRAAIANDEIDLIYANPFDASTLVRDKGFTAVAAPRGKTDEAVIAVNVDHAAQCVEDFAPGLRVVATDDPDVNMMGMIMLEPADLNGENIDKMQVGNFVLVAKALLRNEADAGFFLKESYDNLSRMIREQLRVLITSQIGVIQHCMLAGPKAEAHRDAMAAALVAMVGDDKGKGVLDAMGLQGWDALDQEDTEFMIDLMDTLVG
jgi:phosphonate transport system substrate-binding protein